MRKVLPAILVAVTMAFTLLLTSCTDKDPSSDQPNTSTASGETYVLRLAHPNPPTALSALPSELFGKTVEARSGGRIKFEYYPNGTLGNADELLQQIKTGALESEGFTPTMYLTSLIPYLAAMDLPFAFDGPIQILSGGTAMDTIESDVEQFGLKILGWSAFGCRDMAATKEIKSSEDIKGLKVRVPPSEIYTKTWEAWGAKPVSMPMGDVLTSLQTGTIDAVGFDVDTLLKQFADVAKNVTISGEVYTVAPLVVNKSWFDGLPSDLQELLVETAQVVGDWGALNFERERAAIIQQMIDQGITVNFWSESDIAKLKELAQPVYEYARSQFSAEFVDALLSGN